MPHDSHPAHKYGLFLKRRFLPLFLATFLGSFNDNLLRNGLVVLIAYSASHGIALPVRPEILVTLCAALLVAPMILFSSLAGVLADKYEKSTLVRITKLVELAIMGTAYYGFSTQNIGLLMGLLFVSGTHTTFYSPIKFSILPDHLHPKELLAGNGFMASGSYLAVLLGLVAGGLLVVAPDNLIGKVAIGIACVGFIASLFILPSKPAHPETELHFNLLKGTRDIIAHAWGDRMITLCIMSLSWFMMISSIFMAQFANYAQGVVRADNEVYILFLTLFSVGIAVGCLLCDTILKGIISLKITPLATFGISLFTALMVFNTPAPTHDGLLDLTAFLATRAYWPMLACMTMVAVCGGLFIVPLYAMLQSHSSEQYRSRVMAVSNLSDSLLVTLAAIVCIVLLWAGLGVKDLFLIAATLNLAVMFYVRRSV